MSSLHVHSNTLNQGLHMQPQGPPMASTEGANDGGVLVRPMRLKVLYTFDDQNKTNHLARWPDVLPIQTVALDETTLIGVVELQICIRAIVQSSPELVARIGHDYTVYAYDYSEYENPLVGQGMLSKALATASPTPDAPASQSRQLITGRVCKNILGLFNNGIKETLEVKLRLVPVPTALNNEYLSTMRDMNRATPSAVESSEWQAFMAGQNFAQASNRPSPTPSLSAHQRNGTSLEIVNQLLTPQLEQPPMQFSQNSIAEASGNESQSAKTKGGKAKKAAVKRPRGRKPKAAAATGPAGGNTSGYEEGTDGDDGPAPKKRARVQKANVPNNSAFGASADSLHKAATTSGPLRNLRPLAMSPHPQNSALSNLQDIPRAPTPVPHLPKHHVARDRSTSQGAPASRRESFLSQSQSLSQPPVQLNSPYASGQGGDQIRASIESAGPSPERLPSPADTLPEIGSSPPVMRTRPPSRIRSSPPCPSSPVLPQMPRDDDSGFMSGSLDDLFGEDEEMTIVDNDVNEEDYVQLVEVRGSLRPSKSAPSPPGDFEFVLEPLSHKAPAPRPLVPMKPTAKSRAASVVSEDGQTLPPLRRPSVAPSRPVSRANDKTASPHLSHAHPAPTNCQPSLPPAKTGSPPPESQNHSAPPAPRPRPAGRMVRTASMGSLTLPTIPASDPVLPPSSLHRSQTWSEAPHAATEAPGPMMMPVAQYPPHPPSSGMPVESSGYNRPMDNKKAMIRQRLEMALAAGEMPPFCNNCGAIETPTWRKAWSQDFRGEPGYYEYSDNPGCVTAVSVESRDETGRPTAFKIIKKYLGEAESQNDYQEYLLCNPCGIWMSKYKTLRPQERWVADGKFEERSRRGEAKPRPKQRPSKPKPPVSGYIPTSEAYYPPSDANFPPSEANYPQTELAGPPEGVSPTDTTDMPDGPPQNGQQRKNSIRNGKRLNAMTSDAASAALSRAIKSSPARWVGTQQSPIDVEENDTLGSTRRLLFPSPRKDGSPKVLGEVITNVITFDVDIETLKGGALDTVNKENCPPAIDGADPDIDIIQMIEEEMPHPTTPVQKSPPINPFKTPTRKTPSHRPITRSVSRSVRSAMSPGKTFLFHGTPSRTPGSRRSLRYHDDENDSPFTRTLNQLMSDANNQNSPTRQGNNMDLDFSALPDLPNHGHNTNIDMNFTLEDFFSTDVPMPSSPPRMNFSLYEDPMQNMESINWDDFGRLDPPYGKEVQIKEEPEENPKRRTPRGKECGPSQ